VKCPQSAEDVGSLAMLLAMGLFLPAKAALNGPVLFAGQAHSHRVGVHFL
jgi:hypothetical protein